MATSWPPEGDGLAVDREHAIAQAEEAFERLLDGREPECPPTGVRRKSEPRRDAMTTTEKVERRHETYLR